MMFQYRLFEQAQSKRQKIILPESYDARILQATEILIHRDIVDIILLGNPKHIREQALKMDLDISKAEIVDPQDKTLQEEFAQIFYDMRKERGLTLVAAKDSHDTCQLFCHHDDLSKYGRWYGIWGYSYNSRHYTTCTADHQNKSRYFHCLKYLFYVFRYKGACLW